MKGIFKTLFFIVLCVVIVASLASYKYYKITSDRKLKESQQIPPTAVSSYVVRKTIWENSIKAVGELSSVDGTMLSSEADARVIKILCNSGTFVKKGDLLVELDSAAEVAELEGARARLVLAEITLERQEELRKNNANSKMDLDNAVAEYDNAKAAVEHLEAVVDTLKVVAPFDGILGINLISTGQMLRKGEDVVAIHKLDSLHVDFYLPEKDLSKIKIGNKIDVEVDPFPGKEFHATLTAIDSYVNPRTRNFRVQGTLQNPGNILRAGIFARVNVRLGDERVVYAIPSAAINYAPFGNSVFVINKPEDAKNPIRKITQKFIKIGARRGDMVEVLRGGIKTGDEIASSGTFRLSNNGTVIVNNEAQPSDSLNPNPENS